jgi:hypothetical protein
VRDTDAGIAHSALQPAPGHTKNNGQVSVPLDATPPTPLTVTATASIASQVVDPYCGPTKVESTTGGAYCALQPVSVHVQQNDGQNSAQPFQCLP